MKSLKALRIILFVVLGLIAGVLVIAMLFYPPQYVFRTILWRESDAFDWQKFPSHPLNPSPDPYHFEEAPDPRVEQIFTQLSGAENWDQFLEGQQTQAFMVIQDGKIRYEKYFNFAKRNSILTTFSVAKSFGSALIGIAIQEGYIQNVNDPITRYLPELSERDPRFENITIRDVLLMSSGLDYQEFRPLLLNSDDVLTTYYPDQRKITLANTHIIDPPGQYFRYNKYHPQILGMILERTTGMSVTRYLQTRIWDQVGMEYGGSWSTDSKQSDFEKMETGINARAIDFAKFGVLFLNRGLWQGNQVIPRAWVEESTQPYIPEDYASYYPDWFSLIPGQAYYTYMWWGIKHDGEAYDFAAEGDKGQFIYVSPQKNLVIVRNGIEYGISPQEWLRLFYEFANQYP